MVSYSHEFVNLMAAKVHKKAEAAVIAASAVSFFYRYSPGVFSSARIRGNPRA